MGQMVLMAKMAPPVLMGQQDQLVLKDHKVL
jgi:hypothetical protein